MIRWANILIDVIIKMWYAGTIMQNNRNFHDILYWKSKVLSLCIQCCLSTENKKPSFRGIINDLKLFSHWGSLEYCSYLCDCAAFPKNDEAEQELVDVTEQYRKQMNDMVLTGRYDTRDDFTVVVQPFFKDTYPPKIVCQQKIYYRHDLCLF